MAKVTESEVRPGLVVYLDTDRLRELGGSETNAEVAASGDRAVEGPHQFLILEVDRSNDRCLAVPLFSNQAPGSLPLSRDKMGGSHPRWVSASTYYFSRWQHWYIPISAVAATSDGELSDPGDRSTYAEGSEQDLRAIANWREKNRADFRVLSAV